MAVVDDEELIKQKMLKQLMFQTNSIRSYEEPIVLTDNTFNDFISKNENVVVDCWAEWCYPCRVVSPIVDELSKKYKGRIAFAKLNVDENQFTAMQYGIMSIPTLMIFKKGNLVDQIVGALPKKLIEVNILRALGVSV